MFEVKNGIIKITKGDTAIIHVNLKTKGGSPYVMQSGDTLTLTVKKKPNDTTKLLEVVSSTSSIILSHNATKNLAVGSCCYDIQLTTASGNVFTIQGLRDNMISNMVVFAEVTA